ncbi:MAG: metallophosphoesterase [Phycisphaerae bacterium]|nr:metallophosphoesterase [Phycisphaerae bacterium]
MTENAGGCSLTRREVVKASSVTAALGLGALSVVGSEGSPAGANRKRVVRLAHLTDIHVQPERRAGEGLAACLRHVQSQDDRPELVLTGGDVIMDSLGADEARVRVQWELFAKVMKAENSLPTEHCIGNHDVWGLNRKDSRTSGFEARYGKKWAIEVLGLSRPYRSFDRAGWHFIVLDSTFPVDQGYTAKLDDEQFAWLKGDLAKVQPDVPVLVLSHIPILSVAAFMDGENEKTGDWQVPGAWMHIDARKIKDLFVKHPNVKVCLSGHLHLVDRVDYLGVSYFCNGAVGGGWWKGGYQECEPGYALVDLYADGTCSCRYVTYGWRAQE